MPFVLHAAWIRSAEPVPDGQLFFWAADSSGPLPPETTATVAQPQPSRAINARTTDPRTRQSKAPSYPSQLSVGQLRSQLLAAFPTLNSAQSNTAPLTNTGNVRGHSAQSKAPQTLELHSTTVWLPDSQAAPFTPTTTPTTTDRAHSVVANGSSGFQPQLRQWQITGLTLPAAAALRFLCRLEHEGEQGVHRNGNRTQDSTDLPQYMPWRFGNDLLFWSNAAKFTLQLLAQQQYLPALSPQTVTRLCANWQPVFTDSQLEQQFEQLALLMPTACRAYALSEPSAAPGPTELLNHFIAANLDATIHAWTSTYFNAPVRQSQLSAISTPQAQQWLYSLIYAGHGFDLSPQSAHDVYQAWRNWSEQLHVTRDANFRICFQLEPPGTTDVAVTSNPPVPSDETDLPLATDATDGLWTLRYCLQARDHLHLRLDAVDVWESQNHALHLGTRLLDRPKERLLAGLTVAGRIFPPIARSLQRPQPSSTELTTAEAYTFLTETAALLESGGFGVQLPDWWYTNQRSRLGLRMNMRADEMDWPQEAKMLHVPPNGMMNGQRRNNYIRYDWELLLGDRVLSHQEFEQLTALESPLVHFQGQWVELDPSQVAAAQIFFAEQQPGGRLPFLQALRIAQSHLSGMTAQDGTDPSDERGSTTHFAYPSNGQDAGIPVSPELLAQGLLTNATGLLPIQSLNLQGWFAQALERLHEQQPFQTLHEPETFVGELRPYQRRGLGWLNYLAQLGLGACLADDMGLGKTIQAIALLLHQRLIAESLATQEPIEHSQTAPRSTLLLCPTSVVANWRHEVERFGPTLRIIVHHGSNRLTDEAFADALRTCDLVITSYGTARRDMALLAQFYWQNLILDEAQNIKNPNAKQTKAVRQFQADNRIALTGTPVENRLSELWSIMEFLNPGYLDKYERFRRRYVIPIERYNDEQSAMELRNLVQPFLLRRLKSDPTIIADLPEKNEMVVYCSLTQEQATLYETVVSESLNVLDSSDGIKRRGMVLALLTKLKQICNHPAHFLKEPGPLAKRSGKLNRIMEMMEEVISVGDSALVFTQFVEMGELLQKHFTEQLKADVLFLHGRTTAAQREQMVAAFQAAETPTIFILSLRAGGSGLNLTKANHVFHFDRWWNPAVENQATDRAFRIGQRRDVQVHKFVVAGTLEEHIQQLLDDKRHLAETIVGSGEQWLSELNTDQLRELLLLRQDSHTGVEIETGDEEW